jgi:hypothetical protein
VSLGPRASRPEANYKAACGLSGEDVIAPFLDDHRRFIDHILPTLGLPRKYEGERKIVAGGPMSAVIGLALIAEAGSAAELLQIVTSQPLWSLAHTTATPLTTFAGRAEVLQPARQRVSTLANG